MARAGMRISEVLNLTPDDIEERKLILQKTKSGIRGEVVYIPSKLQRRLNDYIRDNDIRSNEKVFPISYSTSWSMVLSGFQEQSECVIQATSLSLTNKIFTLAL